MRSLLISIFIFVLILVTGCGNTKVTSLRDNLYFMDGNRIQNILVIGLFDNIEDMKFFENKMVEQLEKIGVNALPNYYFFPPMREFSDEEKEKIYSKYNIDSYMLFTPFTIETRKVEVPTVKETTRTKQSKRDTSVYTTKVKIYDGKYKTIPTKYVAHVDIFSVKTGKVIWQADTYTPLSGLATMDYVLKSNAICISKQIRDENIIK